MTEYDPKMIQKFADKLYSQARSIMFLYTFIGILLGGAGGYFAGATMQETQTLSLVVGIVLGGAIGFIIGQERAFVLRLQAQTALCQVKIEENSRKNAA